MLDRGWGAGVSSLGWGAGAGCWAAAGWAGEAWGAGVPAGP
jgi:hypothetical protein